MKFTHVLSAVLTMSALTAASTAAYADGWPANYPGVMLQGFYWDSYQDTKWTNLQSQADELSASFDIIWVPNSGSCGGGLNMGYMPQYWFTNHNSSFGTETELLSMIQAFADRGTGIIADVVVNHRNGVTNWTDFPAEQWDGKTWKLGPEHICCTDEVAYASGQARPTGAPDTGDDFNGARDLDHTNATVQDNIKNYTRCLLEKYGYAGFRYDMVKGYGGQYTKIYNEYSKPTFSVGEYWDSSYDACAAWIEATGKTSAAFDFPLKYCINDAFASGDMSKLVWKANGTTDQPAGLIHWYYPQYSVTFVDNHDTYRDGSKFNGNVVAANAFILLSPGTPCVFLPHWQSNKAAIKALIAVRKSVGITNMSAVRVLRATADCYMAEVTGTNGRAVVKIGPAMASPDGWNDSQIRTYGTDYCVWSDVDNGEIGGGDDDPVAYGPDHLYLLGNLENNSWNTASGIEFTREGSVYTATDVTFQAAPGESLCYFNLATRLGSSWDVVNSADRYGAATEGESLTLDRTAAMNAYSGGNAGNCKSWTIPAGTYTLTADFSNMTIKATKSTNTGIDGLGADETPARWFTLQGQPVAQPAPGNVYIRVRGAEAVKVRL